MKLLNVPMTVVLSLCLAAAAAHADLGSPSYATAKEAYEKGDYYQALPLLKKYKSEDEKFLNDNPAIKTSIDNAIEYCLEILFPSLPGTTFPMAPPPRPDLPVNMAHAFDSKARLRDIIAELKSGNPDYQQMEPMLRILVRNQMEVWSPRLKALGALESISYEGEQEGGDVYEVRFTNGATAWLIRIAPNGKIAKLLFQ